jgi:type II secretory pathway pseudopilin PulG
MVVRTKERGSSLVEVTLALGLIGGVLGAVAGLFVIGAKGVDSGRCASEALSIARNIVEEVRGGGFRQMYEQFGLDGAANSYTVDTRTNANASEWQAELSQKLNGHATIILTAIDAGAPPLNSSAQVRLEVTVHWDEGSRHRTVRLTAVRM